MPWASGVECFLPSPDSSGSKQLEARVLLTVCGGGGGGTVVFQVAAGIHRHGRLDGRDSSLGPHGPGPAGPGHHSLPVASPAASCQYFCQCCGGPPVGHRQLSTRATQHDGTPGLPFPLQVPRPATAVALCQCRCSRVVWWISGSPINHCQWQGNLFHQEKIYITPLPTAGSPCPHCSGTTSVPVPMFKSWWLPLPWPVLSRLRPDVSPQG